MKKKRIKYWLLFIALLAANAYILLHRNDGYKYYPYKSISELYVTDSSLYLKDLKFDGDTVQLEFSQSVMENGEFETWEGFADSINIGWVKADFFCLKMALFKGIHNYTLTSIQSKKQLKFKIDHSSFNGITQNELLYCNLPGPQIKTSPLKTWQSDKGFSEEEKQNATNLLKNKTAYSKDSSDYSSTLTISKLVASFCNNPKGIHAYKLSELRPYGQIQEAMKCNADLACGNYSAIVGYLFSSAGIPNRLVSFQGPAGNWQYGIHYYNEVYLREKQQWVLVDAGNKIIMPFDSVTGKFLHAVDINKLIKLNSTSGKMSYTFRNDSLAIVPYDSINSQHVYYNQSNANLSFTHANADVTNSSFRSFIEFYTFSRDVDFYSDVNRNNWCRIIVKEVAALLFIFVFVCYVFAEVKYKMGKAK